MAIYDRFHTQLKKFAPMRLHCHYKHTADLGLSINNKKTESLDKLPAPQETSNPIVNKGMHELRRVVNAVIKQYGKPDVVRIEMARDLEMNTKRYKENEMRQRKNQKADEKAIEVFRLLYSYNCHQAIS
jgi:CRISPR-associated endonuclease Csn1